MKERYDHIRLDLELSPHLMDNLMLWHQKASQAKQVKPFQEYPVAATRCQLIEDDEVISTGYSFCSSKDQFNKKLGRLIALGRARKGL